MSSKINIYDILSGHLSTLCNDKSDKISKLDIITFYLVPLSVAIIIAYNSVSLSKETIGLVVTIGSILTGLLLNLLILVYDQKKNLPEVNQADAKWEKTQLRHTVIEQLYYNISYSTIIALFLVIVSVTHSLIGSLKFPFSSKYLSFVFVPTLHITSPLLFFLGINLLLTIIMIIKRIYLLLTT